MTRGSFLDRLSGVASIRTEGGISTSETDSFRSRTGIVLPFDHVNLLMQSNGLDVYGGHYKMFGMFSEKFIDLCSWNEFDEWKFSWHEVAKPYFCFGSTGWGDQYAYKYSEMSATNNPPVYKLSGVDFEAQMEWKTFGEFWERELVRNAIAPYDIQTVAVRALRGDLEPRENIIHQPSLLLGGQEDPENTQKMPSQLAMTINGDLYSQLAGETFDRIVRCVEPYMDSRNRFRLKVVWEE